MYYVMQICPASKILLAYVQLFVAPRYLICCECRALVGTSLRIMGVESDAPRIEACKAKTNLGSGESVADSSAPCASADIPCNGIDIDACVDAELGLDMPSARAGKAAISGSPSICAIGATS
jgi:hypothetical protein